MTALTERAPEWPLCGSTYDDACKGNRLPVADAISQRYWQPNPRARVGTLVCDCDASDPLLPVLDGTAPPPTAIVWNLTSGHAHALYMLRVPVGRGGRSSSHAVDYVDAVWTGLEVAMGADLNYNRLLSRGPTAPGHQLETITGQLYDLGELARMLKIPPRHLRPTRGQLRAAQQADSRNVALFDDLRRLGYGHAQSDNDQALHDRLTLRAEQFNAALQYQHPDGGLPLSEVRGIVKSVYRYCVTHRTVLKPKLPGAVDRSRQHSSMRAAAAPVEVQRQRQSEAGQMTADRRREASRAAIRAGMTALERHAQPVTAAALMTVTGLTRATLYRHADLWKSPDS